MKPAAIYVRISNDPEGEHLGTDRQEADCRARAEREGWTVTGFYRDDDTGASNQTKKARKGYPRLLVDARAGKFDVILAYSMSRLTRRDRELLDLIDLYKSAGVEIKTIVSGDANFETADGRFTAKVLGAADAAEAERTAERLERRQKADRAVDRYAASPRLWGWGYVVANPSKPGKTMVTEVEKLNDTEGEALRWAIGRALEGASLRSIAFD